MTDLAAIQAMLIDNLRWACAQAAAEGCQLLIEPINPRDIPGYFLLAPSPRPRRAGCGRFAPTQGADGFVPLPGGRGDVASKLRQYLPTGWAGAKVTVPLST